MKNLLPLFLLFFVACQQQNSEMDTQLKALQEKLTAAEQALAVAEKDETTFIHTVFFWTKKEVTDEQKADFAKNGLGELVKIKSIYHSFYGPPAMTPRKVVDNTYAFALVCHFKSKAAQDEYQADPMHLKFIKDYEHLWEKIQVYDNLVIK